MTCALADRDRRLALIAATTQRAAAKQPITTVLATTAVVSPDPDAALPDPNPRPAVGAVVGEAVRAPFGVLVGLTVGVAVGDAVGAHISQPPRGELSPQ